jgi:hypothetical protein
MAGKIALLLAGIAALGLVASTDEALSRGQPWKCRGPGLKAFNYSGGDSAYVLLTGADTGGTYPVTKTGKIVTGTTSNGTKFTCRLRWLHR